jgi:hypothetical protein
MLFFQGTGTLWKPPAAQEVSVPASYWKPNCTLELRAFDRAGGIKARILAETRKSPIEAALTLQIDFQQPISFTRDAGFYVATEATSHKQQRDSWGGLHYEHYTARAFFIREIS